MHMLREALWTLAASFEVQNWCVTPLCPEEVRDLDPYAPQVELWLRGVSAGVKWNDDGDTWIESLRECVERLSGRGREAIDLNYREELSREEIAQRLAMTPDGVKTLLRRTRAVLRQCVERKVRAEQ